MSDSTLYANLHVYPAPIVNEGRIEKLTGASQSTGLFSDVVICGSSAPNLKSSEVLPNGVKIERVESGRRSSRYIVWRRVGALIRFSLAAYNQFRSTRTSVVNAHSVSVLPVCYLLSRRLGAMLVYDTHELETETVSSVGLQRVIFKTVERILIHRCDAVIVVSDSIADWYVRTYGIDRPLVVRNIPVASPVEGGSTSLKKHLGIPDEVILFAHVGNIAKGRHVDAILEAFGSPRVSHHVLFVGDGPLIEEVQKAAISFKRIHHMYPVPPDRVTEVIRGCDAGLCLIESTCLSFRFSLPNKVLEYVVARRPFVYTSLTEVIRLVGPELSGWLVTDVNQGLIPMLESLSMSSVHRAGQEIESIPVPAWATEVEPVTELYIELVARHKLRATKGTVVAVSGKTNEDVVIL